MTTGTSPISQYVSAITRRWRQFTNR